VPFARSDILCGEVRYGTLWERIYSGPAVRTGRTVGPTWVVDLEVLDRESISFGVWVDYRSVTQWRLNVRELNRGCLRR
jgi:hypothetical protein